MRLLVPSGLILASSRALAFSSLIPSRRLSVLTPFRRPSLHMSTLVTFDPTPFFSKQQPAETKPFMMQQTMIRVKDPEASLKFYTEILGFKLLMHRDFPQWGFSVYFVAHGVDVVPEDHDERWKLCMTTPGCVELTWNHGSEGTEGNMYNTGNADATGTSNGEKVKGGFGHLGITVPDVYEACDRFHKMGVPFSKSPNGGGMKGLAFIKDPDGYLIEILPQGRMITKPIDCLDTPLEGGAGYKDNSK